MGAENRESAAPQGVQPAGARGVQDRLSPLARQREHQFLAGDQEKGAETGDAKGPRYAPAANPVVEEGLSNLRRCEARRGLKNTKMTASISDVMPLDGATAENAWENDARDGVTYAEHKVMEYTELERPVPQMRGPRRLWRASEAKKFLTLRVLGLSVLEGGVRQREAAERYAPDNRTGGELVQDDGPVRESWRKGSPRQELDMFLLGARAMNDLKPEFLQAQSPALEAPAL
ncbi:hypothetical protein Emag_005341 [Eimeria magna]